MQTPCFGTVALELGYLTSDQLHEALRYQESQDQNQLPRQRIGTICVNLGYLTEEQTERIIERVGLAKWLRGSVQGKITGGQRL
jgi:hypothetical protein